LFLVRSSSHILIMAQAVVKMPGALMMNILPMVSG
jgi:hypothetical protein